MEHANVGGEYVALHANELLGHAHVLGPWLLAFAVRPRHEGDEEVAHALVGVYPPVHALSVLILRQTKETEYSDSRKYVTERREGERESEGAKGDEPQQPQ